MFSSILCVSPPTETFLLYIPDGTECHNLCVFFDKLNQRCSANLHVLYIHYFYLTLRSFLQYTIYLLFHFLYLDEVAKILVLFCDDKHALFPSYTTENTQSHTKSENKALCCSDVQFITMTSPPSTIPSERLLNEVKNRCRLTDSMNWEYKFRTETLREGLHLKINLSFMSFIY